MPQLLVPSDSAIKLTRCPGANVTIINQSGIDVFFDSNPFRLNSSMPGLTPLGTKLAANGGEKQFDNFPSTGIWFRAISNTTVEVQP